jgi:hypothetical protein
MTGFWFSRVRVGGVFDLLGPVKSKALVYPDTNFSLQDAFAK